MIFNLMFRINSNTKPTFNYASKEEIKIFNSLDLILSNSSIIRITGSVCATLNASVRGPSNHTKLPSLALML